LNQISNSRGRRYGPHVKRVCVFCGSNSGARPVYAQAAVDLGTAIASRELGLIYGGGKVGLMGVVADAVLAHGGAVIGVIPQALVDKELAHAGLTDLRIVRSMHERKALMAELSDAFVALPGGYGTLEEFCEILTWAQLGLHQKACGLLNVEGFYDSFLAQIERAIESEFIVAEHRSLIQVGSDPDRLLRQLLAKQPLGAAEKWIDRSET
jgi:uncharacterized protein (TIGR00730 family)